MTETERAHFALLVLIACSAASAGCDRKAAPPPAQMSQQDETNPRNTTYAQDSLRDWFIDTSVSDVPGTEADILASYGQPDSVVRLPSANAQDPMKFDTVIEAHFPGISATILKIDGDEQLQSVWVGDSMHITGPIRIGTDTSTLRALLGPAMLHGEKPGYICGKCSIMNETVRFDLVAGKVTGMLFEFPGG